jgi:hypothetical protein
LNRAAVMLAAAGSLTTLGGNGPKDREWVADANWTTHSQKLANAGVDMLNAVRIRSQEQVSRAGDRLVLSCIDCHRQYRLEVPRIWTERPFPPEETQNR